MPLVSGVRRTASAPMLPHGGSRLNASKPEASPKTRCPKHYFFDFQNHFTFRPELASTPRTAFCTKVDFTQQLETQPSNRHSSNCSRRLPRRRKVKHMITRHVFNKSRGHWTRIAPQTCVTERRIGTTQQKHQQRPSPNERTCMGWHKRYASHCGARGALYVPRR